MGGERWVQIESRSKAEAWLLPSPHPNIDAQSLLGIHDTYAGIVARHLDNSPIFAKALKASAVWGVFAYDCMNLHGVC